MYTTYTGERVRIRPYTDEQEFHYVMDRCSDQPNDHWGPWHWPRGERDKEYKGTGMLDPGKYSQFAVERLDTGEVVGLEEFGEMNPGAISTWLGTDIHREHWSNGFGIEAKQLMLCFLFENFPLQSVRADTVSHHRRAWRGLEAVGMKHIGFFRGLHCVDGVRYDIPQFVIFREAWEQQDYTHKVRRGM